MGFWEHLEVLRHCLFRILAVTLVAGIVAFCFKSLLFSVVLAPKSPDFITYRLFERLVGPLQSFEVGLINIELAQQFIIHLKVALWMGLLLVSPYVLYVLFGFVAPALYEAERRYVVKAVSGGYVMFLLGVLLNYFLIFPLTFRFLGTYQVDPSVNNVISLDSYISTLLMLSLALGRFRDARPLLAVGQDGHNEGGIHEEIPPSCHCRCRGARRHHHPYG